MSARKYYEFRGTINELRSDVKQNGESSMYIQRNVKETEQDFNNFIEYLLNPGPDYLARISHKYKDGFTIEMCSLKPIALVKKGKVIARAANWIEGYELNNLNKDCSYRVDLIEINKYLKGPKIEKK